MLQPQQRFTTLDVFRGMTIFLMIVVNTQGSGAIPYAPLEHAQWNGFTLTDFVFPSFLFAVGNAMAFSMQKLQQQPPSTVLTKIFKRTLLIFTVGYLLGWYPFVGWNDEGHIWLRLISETRIMAVLQRIALTYCLAALMIYYTSKRSIIALSVILLFLYWWLLYTFGNAGMQYTVEGNAVRKVDLFILGEKLMYKEKGIAFDPEGILSTIPSIVNVLAGYLAGKFIQYKNKSYECAAKLLIIGNILILAGIFWNSFFPINKKLWTSSYVLYTTGIDLVVLSILFYLIEIRQWKKGVNFFMVFGKNPLAIYVLSNLLGIFFIFHVNKDMIFIDWINAVLFQKIAPGPMGCLMFSISFTLVCWSAGWLLDKRKIYIRL